MTFITWSLPGQFCPFSLTRFRHPQDLPRDRTRALLFLCAVKYDNSFIHKYHASYRLAKEKKNLSTFFEYASKQTFSYYTCQGTLASSKQRSLQFETNWSHENWKICHKNELQCSFKAWYIYVQVFESNLLAVVEKFYLQVFFWHSTCWETVHIKNFYKLASFCWQTECLTA